jgi:hypothetical protein
VVVSADVTPPGADEVMLTLNELKIPTDDYLLAHLDVIAPSPTGPHADDAVDGSAWVSVMGEARANSRPLGRYMALMTVAGVIASLGVITDNAILIVGAMAVSPGSAADLLHVRRHRRPALQPGRPSLRSTSRC